MEGFFSPEAYVISKADIPIVRMGGYEAQWVEWAGHAMVFEVAPAGFPPGGELAWDGLPENLCQCPHWGYVLKGKARLRFSDGSETIISAGDLYYCPPGHQFSFLEDFENIEWNPAA